MSPPTTSGLSSDGQKWTPATIENARAEKATLGVLGSTGAAKLNTVAAGSFLRTNALHLTTELDDQAVMHHAVNRGRCGQVVLEDEGKRSSR